LGKIHAANSQDHLKYLYTEMAATTCSSQVHGDTSGKNEAEALSTVDNASLGGVAEAQSDAPSDSLEPPKGWRFTLLFACILVSMFCVGYVRGKSAVSLC